MLRFEQTRLWRQTLAEQDEDNPLAKAARERLRCSFLLFRERAGLLAEEISRSYPRLTVHGITHIDALWEMADLIAGGEHALTPAEAFVLGGSFLVHDLGNGLAAYPKPESQLLMTPEYRDALAAGLRRAGLDQHPDIQDAAPDEIAQAALEETLRLLHAKQAGLLPTREWRDREGRGYKLIEDDGIREYYAEVIGSIAHSHWWAASLLPVKLKPELVSPAAWMPSEWTVDTVRVACLLRVADAAHLDARRAPAFLRAIRSPGGLSEPHWQFQETIGRPALRGDRLVFTSSPFPQSKAVAWWLCFDSLRLLDRELHAVDIVLSARSVDAFRPRFAARGVAGVTEPAQLADYIRTSDWTPIDAKVHVSDVPALIRALGGEALYGNNPHVPLRELIQNAADAVRARRALEPNYAGRIVVRHGRDNGVDWIEVLDDGVGMSQNTMGDCLLDFGKSYWSSYSCRADFPGLTSSAFAPTGQFGIGFFSVFMWGDAVRVISRKFDEAREATRVLEFSAGLKGRPVLRPAKPDERLSSGGSVVRISLRRASVLSEPTTGSSSPGQTPAGITSWKQACLTTAPSLDVDLWYGEEGSSPKRILRSCDWQTAAPRKVLSRLAVNFSRIQELLLDRISEPSGEVVGRASVAFGSGDCIVTVGGLRADTTSWVCGILTGKTSVAARNRAVPLCSSIAIQEWAQRQVLLLSTRLDKRTQWGCADALAHLGADVTGLAAVSYRGKLLSIREAARRMRKYSRVFVVDSNVGEEVLRRFSDPVVLVERRWYWDFPFGKPRGSLVDQIVNALAASWGVSLAAVESVSKMDVLVDDVLPDNSIFDYWYCEIVNPGSRQHPRVRGETGNSDTRPARVRHLYLGERTPGARSRLRKM